MDASPCFLDMCGNMDLAEVQRIAGAAVKCLTSHQRAARDFHLNTGQPQDRRHLLRRSNRLSLVNHMHRIVRYSVIDVLRIAVAIGVIYEELVAVFEQACKQRAKATGLQVKS